MSEITKVLLRVLMLRMRKSLRPEIAKTQFGFVPGKGTRNAIFTLSMLMERCIEVQKDLYICFIDYSKAFDKVKLFEMLNQLDIDGKNLRVLRNLYWDKTAAVRVDGELSEYTNIKRGVRQGCVMLPDLFNLYSEVILRNLDESEGLKANGENLNNLRYAADDTSLLAGSEEDLQRLLNIVVEESEKLGLSLNVKKTECMVVSKKKNNPECKLFSKGEQIRQVQKFKYLGYTLTSDGKCRTEIKKRIAIAKVSFQKMSTSLKNRNISFSTKLRVLKTYMWSILLYGCETWTITAETKKNLEAAEMWFYRRMVRISWKEKRTNESILEETNQERSLINPIRKRQLKILGHICRHKGLEFLSLTGKIEGTRSRGRQRITFLDSLSSFVTGNNKDNIALLRMTEDRDRWRIMIADVCLRERELRTLKKAGLPICV